MTKYTGWPHVAHAHLRIVLEAADAGPVPARGSMRRRAGPGRSPCPRVARCAQRKFTGCGKLRPSITDSARSAARRQALRSCSMKLLPRWRSLSQKINERWAKSPRIACRGPTVPGRDGCCGVSGRAAPCLVHVLVDLRQCRVVRAVNSCATLVERPFLRRRRFTAECWVHDADVTTDHGRVRRNVGLRS